MTASQRAALGILLGGLVSNTSAAISPAHWPGSNASWPFHTYKTVPFNPPVVNVTHHLPRALEGDDYLFFAPDGPKRYDGAPLIVDGKNGELIWNGPSQHAFNFGVQSYRGEQVLVGWNGTVQPEPVGRGYGEIVMWNSHYEVIHRTTLAGDFVTTLAGSPKLASYIDLHEVYVTERGTMLVTANNITQTDLRSVGGSEHGWIISGLFYEIDIAANKVLFQWDSIDHLDTMPLTASEYLLGSEGYTGTNISTAWGYFHINAVAPYDDGYIISSRYLCSAIAIAADGSVKWRIGGRSGGNFVVDDEAKFCYQHDIRAVSVSDSSKPAGAEKQFLIHMHDNENAPLDYLHVPTSAKILAVDLDRKHVSLAQKYANASGPIFTTAQGNMQIIPSTRNVFVGHGWIPVAEEFSSAGKILSTVQFGAAIPRPGGGYLSAATEDVTLVYRAFRQPWIGCPKSEPDVVAERTGPKTWVYVSWNGATEVEGWKSFRGFKGLAAI